MDQPDIALILATASDYARRGQSDELAEFLARGVPVDLADDDGNTLLMLASYHGQSKTVAMLLERGADPDRLNDRGQPPIAGALFKGEDDVVRLLVVAGADLDAGHPSARAAASMFGQDDLLDR